MSNNYAPSPISKVTGIAGYNYYPITADALQDAILSQGDFTSISEVSRFASALVKLVATQALEISDMRTKLEELDAYVGRLSNG